MKEKEYRALERYSYSLLNEYRKSPIEYYKKYIVKEKEFKRSYDMTVGSIVDIYLSADSIDEAIETVKEDYFISTVNIPEEGTNGYKFVTFLYEAYKQTMDCKAEWMFMEAAEKCYGLAGIKKPGFEMFIQQFDGGPLKAWFRELVDSYGKEVIPARVNDIAMSVYNKAVNHPNIRDIIHASGPGLEVRKQMVVQYELNGLPFKSMLDKVIINHNENTICPFDYKCTWEIEAFESNYLKNGYYLQAGLYNHAVECFRKENRLKNYTIHPMQYVLLHSQNQLEPIIKQLSELDIEKAMTGFTSGNKYYKGVQQLSKELHWATENNRFGIEYEAANNKGKSKLKIEYK